MSIVCGAGESFTLGGTVTSSSTRRGDSHHLSSSSSSSHANQVMMNNLLTKMKKAGKAMVDSGAKTMLKTDMVFLEREVKQRKQSFGVEVYELMESLESDTTGMDTATKESKIRLAFDQARKDIAVIQAKMEVKQEELLVLERKSAAGGSGRQQQQHYQQQYVIPPSSGVVLNNGQPMQQQQHHMEHDDY